ncbi:MAG: sigma-54-dependent Fis family transcriptional regulator [Rhodospirillales bacterium CG15_BIG_FIL_POST_REV_8_21_14_020_66_15]|nr:MAG: sigma-54-dependent Fis family transcriptional regulator [Rhodospirillales bacterium CG15_BIG_FIL_POST_REV_8_21_14_020_66_15]
MPPPDSGFVEPCVLIVDDDDIMRTSLEDRFRLEGIALRVAEDISGALNEMRRGDVDLVITDIRLPDGSGADLFHDIALNYPGTPVILMTAFGTVSDAVASVKAGAVDYLTKPFEMHIFIEKVRRKLRQIQDARLSAAPLGIPDETFRPGAGLLGKSKAMRQIERLLARLHQIDSSVLITGESGVGKEVVAGMIHHNGRRAGQPLVTVNCAALPLNLVESELFGHEKGAFTGAGRRHVGRFEQANHGTIFLDEIAEVPPEIQVKLLRVLQEQKVDRVGGETPIPLDVRVIAATQVDLHEAIKNGRFRSDLFWRLNVIHVEIPPLRARREDILYLAARFVAQNAKEMDKPVSGLSRSAENYLLEYSFPGNIRELRNMLERAVALCDGTRIEKRDLVSVDQGDNDTFNPPHTLKRAVEDAERETILAALDRHDWAISRTAKELGISRKNLWEKMRRRGIEQ